MFIATMVNFEHIFLGYFLCLLTQCAYPVKAYENKTERVTENSLMQAKISLGGRWGFQSVLLLLPVPGPDPPKSQAF